MDEHATEARQPRTLVAVLAGGLSTRMGAPKASTRLCGRPLISYPLRAAREAGLEAVVVAKRSSELPPLRERIVYEPEHPRHPLCGIVTALRHAGAAVIAVGCDMPFLSAEMLAWLARTDGDAAASGSPRASTTATAGDAATVTAVAGRVQPLPALYRPADVPALERALAAERSLRDALGALAPRVLDESVLRAFGRPERLCFSVNDARDLRTASRWTAR